MAFSYLWAFGDPRLGVQKKQVERRNLEVSELMEFEFHNCDLNFCHWQEATLQSFATKGRNKKKIRKPKALCRAESGGMEVG